jgi:hypothetical protein
MADLIFQFSSSKFVDVPIFVVYFFNMHEKAYKLNPVHTYRVSKVGKFSHLEM